MDATRRWAIRAAFFIPVLLVVGQFLIIRAGFGEPYPGLMMPGFKGTRTTTDGSVVVESVGIHLGFADGSVATTTLRDVFGELPSSHYWTVATNMFRHTAVDERPTPERSALKSWILRSVTPIRDRLEQQRRMGRPMQPDTEQWLRRRLAAMYPERTSTRVEFEWRLEEHRRVHGVFELARQTVADRYVINLSGPADARD